MIRAPTLVTVELDDATGLSIGLKLGLVKSIMDKRVTTKTMVPTLSTNNFLRNDEFIRNRMKILNGLRSDSFSLIKISYRAQKG